MLADKKLVSVAINANATAQYDPQGASAMKADLQVTNLVVKDPKGQFPATPLEARMQVDASLKQAGGRRAPVPDHADAHGARDQPGAVERPGGYDPDQRHPGEPQAGGGLAGLHQLLRFVHGEEAGGPELTLPAPAQPRRPAERRPRSPEPIKLPLQQLHRRGSIRRLYLHEMEIADWQAPTKIDGGHVVMNPFKLTLNGAPVNSDGGRGPGRARLEIRHCRSARKAIPLAPLVNSFQPERKGQLSGTVTAQGRLTGAGITGASLQKNLGGHFDFSTTNLNLAVINIQNPIARTLVNVVAAIPELVRNPAAKVTSVLGNLTGLGETNGGLAGELQRSPIDSVMLQTAIDRAASISNRRWSRAPRLQRTPAEGSSCSRPISPTRRSTSRS